MGRIFGRMMQVRTEKFVFSAMYIVYILQRVELRSGVHIQDAVFWVERKQ